MCMENVKPWPDDVEKPRFGYKVFRLFSFTLDEESSILPCFGCSTLPYEVGKWCTAKNEPGGRLPIEYEPGFHMFFERSDAQYYILGYVDKSMCVLRVEVAGHLGVGHTTTIPHLRAFTAKSMRIVQDPPDIPPYYKDLKSDSYLGGSQLFSMAAHKNIQDISCPPTMS